MSAPGMWEIAFLAVLALLIFGPDRLPGMARSVGRTISAVKREAQGTMDELKRSADLQEIRQAAGDLRSTTADLKRSAALTGPVASGASAPEGSPAVSGGTAQAQLPAPFDADAT